MSQASETETVPGEPSEPSEPPELQSLRFESASSAAGPPVQPLGSTRPEQRRALWERMPASQMPESQNPESQMSASQLPWSQMPSVQAPALEMRALQMPSSSQMPASQMPESQLPAVQMPAFQMLDCRMPTLRMPTLRMPVLPASQTQESQMPASQKPAAQLPASQMPAGQAPAFEMRALQMPASQMPASQMPASQMPQLQMPANQAENHQPGLTFVGEALPLKAPSRARTYQRLRPHMRVCPPKSLTIPKSLLPGTGASAAVTYVPVQDPVEGLSYMMCSFCKGDRIFRVLQNFLRHMESGECPVGQQQLLKIRETRTVAGPATPAAPAAPAAQAAPAPEVVPQPPAAFGAVPSPDSVPESTAEPGCFGPRRALLSELRLLAPRRYAELALSLPGLLQRSLQDLAPLVQQASIEPEMETSKKVIERPVVNRHPVEALMERLRGDGFELDAPFSFEDCRSEFLIREAKLLTSSRSRKCEDKPPSPKRQRQDLMQIVAID
ncbi:unnamed protein product [Effrenium voratum]|uniref:Uncharacterized protein n=1 Tax=Effrenium voratum TaxID=2562239 RepID=A0AA36I093_9DINO|nr:unnamed protein product [Effrenium voratum]